jgi:HSP20 family protein
MQITRYRSPLLRNWPPFEFDDMERRLRRLASEVLEPFRQTEPMTLTWTPAVEIVEKDDELLLTAELPGLGPDDVEIELENNILTLRGEKKEEHEEKTTRFHVWERAYGAFERSLPLPKTVNAEAIKADFHDGLLEVHMPKLAEARGRKIAIKAGR